MPGEAGVLALLNELQAAEHAGATALERWIADCRDPLLRGGLRVARVRDAGHAAIAVERLTELGGTPGGDVAPALDRLCDVLGSRDASDGAKLEMLLARFPRSAHDPFAGVSTMIDGDDETRAMLETVRDDDRLSVEWLRGVAAGQAAPPVADHGGAEPRDVAAFVRALHAATEGARDVRHAWVRVCGAPGLRGALRAVAVRTTAHASLLAERVEELTGEAPRDALAPSVLSAARSWYGAADVADADKLAALLEWPAAGTAAALVDVYADTIGADVETREMLRLIAAAEHATHAWLVAYRGGGARTRPAAIARLAPR